MGQQIVCRAEIDTNAADGIEMIVERLVSLAHARLDAFHSDFPQQRQPTHAGVASAGQIEAGTGAIAYATQSLPGWIGLPLGARLTAALHMPVTVENDVNCFAVAEAKLGAGRGFANLLMITVGTGIGGGVIIDGELYRGRRGGAGEVGQLLVERTGGRPCSERVSGCLEAYAASSVMVARSGYASIQALGADYCRGQAIPAVDEGAAWLGFGLASLAHTLAPEAIIIGGSVGLLGPRYLGRGRTCLPCPHPWLPPFDPAPARSPRPQLRFGRRGTPGTPRLVMFELPRNGRQTANDPSGWSSGSRKQVCSYPLDHSLGSTCQNDGGLR